MDAETIRNVLNRKIAVCYGGTDRGGSPILFFPSQGETIELPAREIVTTVDYMKKTIDPKLLQMGFTVIIDARSSWIRYIKSILKQIQSILPPYLKHVIIIQPQQFLEKSKYNIDFALEMYAVKILLVSFNKLPRYADLTQLPMSLGGSMDYDHKKWIQSRIEYEKFLKETNLVVQAIEHDNRSSQIEVPKLLKNPDKVKELVFQGEIFISQMRNEQTVTENGELKSAVSEQMVKRVENMTNYLKDHSEEQAAPPKPPHNAAAEAAQNPEPPPKPRISKDEKTYKEYSKCADGIIRWIEGPGEKWLLCLHETGDNRDEAIDLERDHAQLVLKCQELQLQTNELQKISKELAVQEHPRVNEIARKQLDIDAMVSSFVKRAEHQNQVIRASVAFYTVVDQFTKQLNEMLEHLCSEAPVEDAEKAQESLVQLDESIELIDRAFGELTVESSTFQETLSSREKKWDGHDVARDYLPGIMFMRGLMEELKDRKSRAAELADIRRLRSQQTLQLLTAESDTEQAICWIVDLSRSLLVQQGSVGTNTEEVEALKVESRKLEETARNTYDYGKQLLHISGVLRRSLRADLSENIKLSGKLEDAWARFCKTLSDRSTRLNVSMAFYKTVKQVNERLKDLCHEVDSGEVMTNGNDVPVMALKASTNRFSDSIERSKAERMQRQLDDEVMELRAMGDCLLNKLDESNPNHIQDRQMNGSAVDEIQRRLSEIENQRQRLHRSMQKSDRKVKQSYETSHTRNDWNQNDMNGMPEFLNTDGQVIVQEMSDGDDECVIIPPGARHIQHDIIIEHIPIPVTPTPKTTLDEILINDLKESTNYCLIQVAHMQPSLLDVGTSLEEAQKLQRWHQELLDKIQAKQDSIEELLSQADSLVTQQQKPEADVYESMANSLGSAWKELNRQLQLRSMVLQQAVSFFTSSDKHKSTMDEIERMVLSSSTQVQQSHDHAALRKKIQDNAIEMLGYGQITIEKLREIGVLADNMERPRDTAIACEKIETVMLQLEDQRSRVEELLSQRREQLEFCLQASQLLAELSQIEEWVHQIQSDLETSGLGDSEQSSRRLLGNHEQLLTEAKTYQEKSHRLWKLCEQLASQGYSEGQSLLKTSVDVKRRVDGLITQLEQRRQNLESIIAFFTSLATANARLDSLEQEINSLSQTQNSHLMLEKSGSLSTQIHDISNPAVQQGRSLLQNLPRTNKSVLVVETKLDELQRRVIRMDELCSAHRAQQLLKSQQQQELISQLGDIRSWLLNVGEAFLLSHRDMGTTLPSAHEFVELHKRLANDISMKNGDVARLTDRVRALPLEGGVREITDQLNQIQERWNKLRTAADYRCQLGMTYEQFHKLASEMGTDINTLEASLKTEVHPPQIEELWHSLHGVFQQLKHQSTKFMDDTRKVHDDPSLDTQRARTCVETLLDHLKQRLENLTRFWNDYKERLTKDKETAENWKRFLSECHQAIQWFNEILKGPMLTYANFDGIPQHVMEQQQKVLDDLPQDNSKLQTELESKMKALEKFELQNREFMHEKQRVFDELVRAHRKLQAIMVEYKQITTNTVTFFGHLHKLDMKLSEMDNTYKLDRLPQDAERVRELVQQHNTARAAVDELFRSTQLDGNQAVNRANVSEHLSADAKREVAKVPQLIAERNKRWDELWERQRKKLNETSQELDVLFNFEKMSREVTDQIEAIERRLQMLKQQTLTSVHSVQTSKNVLTEISREMELLDRRVMNLLYKAESLASSAPRGDDDIRRKKESVSQLWQSVKQLADDLRKHLTMNTEFFTVIEEVEIWCHETMQYVVTVGKQASTVKTSEDANQLMGQLEARVKPRQHEQQTKITRLESISRTIYGDESDHKLTQIKLQYKQIIDSLHVINDQLFTLAETLRQREMTTREQQKPVGVPPKFVQVLKDGQVTEGNSFEFIARVTGDPDPDIIWLKDNVSIHNNPDYDTSCVNGSCILRIEETFTEDSAVFTCRATNPLGTAETCARLTVKESPLLHMQPPDFTRRLQNATVKEGDHFEFESHVIGNPAPIINWFKNDDCVDTNPDYNISYNNGVCKLQMIETFLEDDARFTCRAANPAGEAATSAKLSVTPKEGTEAPVFERPLQPLQVFVGERTVLECYVRGKPAPELTWRHNNRTIRETNDTKVYFDGYRASLEIGETYPPNTGTYTVIAKNRAGEASCTSNVTIKQRAFESDTEFMSDFEPLKPRFMQELQNMTVLEGKNVQIEAVILGNPEPEVMWYRDELPIREGPGVRFLFDNERCALLLQNTTMSDQGTYKCAARNAMGQSVSVCRLTVTPTETAVIHKPQVPTVPSQPPKFLQHPAPHVVVDGNRVMFECKVIGIPEPKVVWFKDGKNMVMREGIQAIEDSFSGIHRLVINSAQPHDAGMYSAVARNAGGEAKSSASLQVNPMMISPVQFPESRTGMSPSAMAPEVIRPLQNISAPLGSRVVLECEISGNPKPKTKWDFNGKPLPYNHCHISNRSDIYTLIIPNLTEAHMGHYQIHAENVRGSAEASGVINQMVPMPRTIAPVQVQHELHDVSSYEATSVKTLRHQNDQMSQFKQNREMVLVQHEPLIEAKQNALAPKFQQTLVSVVCYEGESARFEAELTGSPEPEVSWQKDGQPLLPGPGVTITHRNGRVILEIDNTAMDFAGKYTCAARNAGGIATSSAQLVVRRNFVAPDFIFRLVSKEVREGEKLRWEVRVNGDPSPKVRWYRLDQEIINCAEVQLTDEGDGVHVLTIPSLMMADAGQFTVKAENEGGEARSTADLVVRSKDSDPGNYFHVTKVVQEKQEMGMEMTGHQLNTQNFKRVT